LAHGVNLLSVVIGGDRTLNRFRERLKLGGHSFMNRVQIGKQVQSTQPLIRWNALQDSHDFGQQPSELAGQQFPVRKIKWFRTL
jgi:hypothetical protein